MIPGIDTVYQEYTNLEAPVTYLLMVAVAVVFLFEVLLTVVLSIERIQVFATGLFGVYPWVAWPLSPLLHKGISHFAATMLGLVVVGIPVERHWNRERYIGFIVLVGYGSIVFGAAVLYVFSDQQVAFYGFSGVVYGLAGFALAHFTRHHDDLLNIEWLAVLIGVVALIDVLIDPFTGPYFASDWLNGGHTSGFIVGVVVGLLGWKGCNV